MKPLMNFETLVNLHRALKSIYNLHYLLSDSENRNIYAEVLYEKTQIELDFFEFKSHKQTVYNDCSNVFVVIIMLLNNGLDFDLFWALFIIEMYNSEYTITIKPKKTSFY